MLDEETYRHVHSIFDNYPFFDRLYPHAIETLRYLRTLVSMQFSNCSTCSSFSVSGK